ncbi:DinB family protein [Arthrobacter sp. JUb115]|uniref:DinB family protein n=1 Tax=Arthrobacter sp. JUb115 TaxID=2485108 RepID=UPI00105C0030|nr:DinB family protein [Arthrobacter sp. JUb115]TDU27905.1 DinB family protein [Arthrobacter sp. JUb115]
MKVSELLSDLAQRTIDAVRALPQLGSEQLNAHPGNHPNSIAWLLWHSGREADIQLSALSGQPELWEQFRDRFNLGELGDSMGFGHSAEQARSIIVNDQQLLLDYLEACFSALGGYASRLREEELDEIIDRSWDPAVTRGVRLVSIIDDASVHVGQAAYAAGALG